MLREKGIKLEMELYLPLISSEEDVQPTKLQLQYVRNLETSDIAETLHSKKRIEVIQELGLNLESQENNAIKDILKEMKLGRISRNTAFTRIKLLCPNSEKYNAAELLIRIGKRHQKVRWDEFDSLLGNYDITERLHSKFKLSSNYLGALTELTDEYYDSIVEEESADEG